MRAATIHRALRGWVLLSMAPGFWSAGPVSAAGLRQLSDGWLLQPAETILILDGVDSSASADDRYPGCGGAWISTGQTQLFGMPELTISALAAGWRRALPGFDCLAGFSWERTGGDLFLEDQKRMFLGLGSATRIGVDFCRREIRIENVTEAVHSETALVLSHHRVFRRNFLARIEWRVDLNDPPVWFGRRGRRALAAASLVIPQHGLGAAVELNRRGDGMPGLSLDLCGGALGCCGLGMRGDMNSGSIGPVTLWRVGRLLIRTSHVVHPELGLTHRVNLVGGTPAAALW